LDIGPQGQDLNRHNFPNVTEHTQEATVFYVSALNFVSLYK